MAEPSELKQAVTTALEGVRSLKNGQDEIKEGVIASLNAVSQLDQRETDTRQAAFTALDAVHVLDGREAETRESVKVALEATKELYSRASSLTEVRDDHEGRIITLEDQLKTQPAPAPQPQPSTTAAPAATPELRTDDIPDLPDPVVRVVEGGIAVDRVKRTWLNINQLQEDERDLDATSEPSTPTPIRQASIPQRRPRPLYLASTEEDLEAERRQEEKRRREEEESRRVTNRFVDDEQILEDEKRYGGKFAENLYGYDRLQKAHKFLLQERRQPAPEPVPITAFEKPKAEKRRKNEKNNLMPIIVGAIILLIAIATIIWASSRSSVPAPQTTTTTVPVERTSNVVFQLPQGTALNLSAK